MENPPPEYPPIGSTIGSQDPLLPQPTPRPSNNRALKVAGLTTLACLLLASQVFTAYMVFSQRQDISNLKKSSEKMSKQVTRSSQSNYPMRLPIGTLPLMSTFTQIESGTTNSPDTRVQETVEASVEEQLRDFLEDFQQPHFNETFLGNLQRLKQDMNESQWKSFEAWMRHWLIFQLAQQKPQVPTPRRGLSRRLLSDETTTTTTTTTSTAQPRCHSAVAAAEATGLDGVYIPQCDEEGNYLPMQCWHSAGTCWCVEEDGTVIEGSRVRGRADCDE